MGESMQTSEVTALYQYNYWANGLILKVAGAAGEDLYRAPAQVSFGSLQGTLVHILSAEWLWRLRCQEGKSPSFHLRKEDFPTLRSLGERWLDEEQKMLAYIAGLKDSSFESQIRYTNTMGVDFSTPLWQILLHVVNHGTQFRSEAAVVLTEAGFSPGNLDLIRYVRERPA